MKYNNRGIQEIITDSLALNYKLNAISVDFIPVGQDSYSYVVTTNDREKYFVKYSNQEHVNKHINLVNELLLQLKDFDFVVPPLVIDGKSAFQATNGLIYVYPYIEGEVVHASNPEFGQKLISKLTGIMTQIHNATDTVTVPLFRENFQNGYMKRFEKIKQAIDIANVDEDIRKLYLENNETIECLIEDHNTLAKIYQKQTLPLVLTHGDITGLNIILSKDGIKLTDWDGAMFAPKERDLNFFVDNSYFSLEHYLLLTKQKQYNPELRKFYGQKWSIGSILQNFESLLKDDKNTGDKEDYIAEINESVGYYR